MPQGECPHIVSAAHALGFEFSHNEVVPALQAPQLPHAIGNGTTTRSPTFRLETPRPSSTTSPMNSWPSTSPFSMLGTKPLYKCRSEPQIAVLVTRMMASRGLKIWGSGTSWTSTFLLPIQQLAFTTLHPFQARLCARERRPAARHADRDECWRPSARRRP